MSLLDDLFVRTVLELTLADTVTADAGISVGHLYPVEGADDPIELTLESVTLADAVNKRLAVKVMEGDGEVLTITVPGGMLIEGDDGVLDNSIDLTQRAGNYREWLCDAAGNWLLVSWITRE